MSIILNQSIAMEISEVSTISYPLRGTLIPFCLTRSNNDQYCLITRQSSQILNLCFKHNEDANLNFIKSTYKVPTSMPTNEINVCHETIYNRATDAQKQELTLDGLLMPELSQVDNPNICFTSVKWSPAQVTVKNEAYIAGLTNYGGCSICYRQDDERYLVEIANISDIWLTHCRQQLKQNEKFLRFEKLKEMVRHIQITAIDWNTIFIQNQCGFAVISASGRLGLFSVSKQNMTNVAVEQKFIYETERFKVNLLKWVSYYDHRDKLHSMILLGDLAGNLQMYDVIIKDGSIQDIERGTTLWNKNDEQKFSEVHAEFNNGTKNVVIVACKGSHVLVFIVNSTGIIRTMFHYVPNLFITGFCRLSIDKYIVCTMGGTIQELTIQKESEIVVNNMKCTTDFKKFALYGILPSSNKAYWILAIYPRQATDHLIFRKPTTISFCTTRTFDIMDKLQKNDSFCLSNYYDCAEMLRYLELKRGDIPLDYFEEINLPIEITDQYLYKLKIRLIACNARSSYYKRKSLMVQSNYLRHEFNIIRKTIFAITYYKRLRYLMNIENFNELLPFQQLAAKSWRSYLIDYLDANNTIVEAYEKVRDTLKISFDILLEETRKFEDSPPEICLYCNEFVKQNSLTCPDKHEITRCCVTLIQIPIINHRSCRQCHAAALDDIKKLQEATMMRMTEFYCPACDIPLEINNSVFIEGGTKIINIYKPPNINWPSEPIQIYEHPSIYMGDFNSHHTQWKYLQNNENGNALVDWYERNNLYLVFDVKVRAQWPAFTTELDKIIRWIPPNIQNYPRFLKAVTSTAKKYMPRGFRKKYIPGWNAEIDRLYQEFLESGESEIAEDLLSDKNT